MSKKQAILITGCDSGFGYSLTCHLASKHPEFLTIACCYSMNSEGKRKIGDGFYIYRLFEKKINLSKNVL